MPQSLQNPITHPEGHDQRWKDLYRIGAFNAILVAVLIALAIAAFFIWPFAAGEASTLEVFEALQADRIGTLISLDISLLLIQVIYIPLLLALYMALKPVNESWALIAVVFGLVAIVLSIIIRPVAELSLLSDLHAASSEAEKMRYLAAGEAMLSVFNGTSWIVATILIGLSGLIEALLMRRSPVFRKATAIVGIITVLPALLFFLPVVGKLLLLLNTLLSIVWMVQIALDLTHYTKQVNAGQ